jgi:hypothetical protein
MSRTLSVPNASRTIGHLLKAIILIVFFYLIFLTFSQKENLDLLFLSFLRQSSSDRLPFLIMALALVYFNWFLEAVKWQKLMFKISPMTLFSAFRAVLIGLATSIFTPNRIGEYIGRIIIIPGGKRTQAATMLSLGSLIQVVFIIGLGLGAIVHLTANAYPLPLDLSWYRLAMALFAGLSVLAYFNFFRIAGLLQKFIEPSFPKIAHQLSLLNRLESKHLWQISGLTLIRLFIYVFQYWLLLCFFDINVPVDLAVSTILLGYFIQTGLPLPTILALVARGEIALLIWNSFGVNELSVLAASYGLWVINVVIPALVGMIYVLKIKLKRS